METSFQTMPYKGLMPYAEEDAHFFFGRDADSQTIISNLMASRLTLLVGSSGVGKSSVLLAGAAHKLRRLARENFDESGTPELAVAVFKSWRDDPITGLTSRIQESVAQALNVPVVEASQNARSLSEALEIGADLVGGDLLIILDQFEEYFLYHAQEDGEGTFGFEFPRAVNCPDLRVNFLIALRDDSLSKLDRFQGSIPAGFDNYLRVDHLNNEAARQAIERPIELFNRLYAAGRRQIDIQPDLVEVVLRQLKTGNVLFGEAGGGVIKQEVDGNSKDGYIETPYLQLVMTRLWEEEMNADSHVLRLETLERLGGAESIVRTHLDKVMAKIPPNEQEIAARVFYHLVTPSGSKIAQKVSDLAAFAQKSEQEVVPLLNKLVQSETRVLRSVPPPLEEPGKPRCEIFHDVLAAAILDWRQRYVRDQEVAEAENRAATEAGEREREAARENELEQARSLAAEQALRVEAEKQRALEQQQRIEEQARAARRLRRLVAALAVVSALAILAAGSTFVQSRRLEHRGRELSQALEKSEDLRLLAEGSEILAREEQEKADAEREVAETQTKIADKQSKYAKQEKRRADELRKTAEERLEKVELLTQVARAGQDAKDVSTAQGPILFAIEGLRSVSEPSLETDQISRQGLAMLQPLLTEPSVQGSPLHNTKSVSDIAFTTTGRYFVTANADGTVRMAESNTGQEVWKMEHGGAVNALSVSQRYIATASSDGTAIVWEVAGGKETAKLKHDGPVESVAFSPDGKFLATGSSDHKARVWDFIRDRVHPVATMPHPDDVWIVSYSPDGRLVATVCMDGIARLWDASSAKTVFEMKHSGGVLAMAFSPDGRYIATASSDWTAKLWSSMTGRPLFTLSHTAEVTSIAFSRDGRYIATGSTDGIPRIWSVQSGRLVMAMKGHADAVTALAFNPDGRYLATASADRTARIWDVAKRESKALILQHDGKVTGLAFRPLPDWGYLVTASAGNAQMWKILKGAEVDSVASPATSGAIAFRSEGLLVASMAHRSPRGTIAAPGGVQLWELGKGLKAANGSFVFDESVSAVALSSGQAATANKDKTSRVFDLRDGRELARMVHDQQVERIAISANGQYVATATALGTANIWNAHVSNQRVGQIYGEVEEIDQIALSADGSYLAAASEDYIKIWDWKSNKEIARLTEVKSATALAFSPDGKHLATASRFGSVVRLWEWRTRREVGRIEVGRDQLAQVIGISFGERNGFVGTVSNNGMVRVWLWRPKDIAEELCKRLTRNMTGVEWLKYMGDQPYSLTCDNLEADPELYSEGESLATQGDIRGAVNLFRAALRYDPDSDPDSGLAPQLRQNPERYARKLQLRSKAGRLAATGKIKEAVSEYEELEEYSKGKLISAGSWNNLCWYGGLWNQPDNVIGACEKAVKLGPNSGAFADSRGLVKALLAFREGSTGNHEKLIKESIEDFEKYIKSQDATTSAKTRRRKWIDALRVGRNPFTIEELKELRESQESSPPFESLR